ncbi:hypothetical protein F4680DRAFT_405694 [Xylaria scruposa]|nr:hypothetical protein F4680DRAFT_405694 [Xylaria scruposa]
MPDQMSQGDYSGWRLIVFISVFTPLQLFLIALRFYARSLTKFRYDLADILVVIGLVSQFVATGIDIGAVIKGGVGYHIEYLSETEPEKITTFFKFLVAISVWYFATITITKLAICKLYGTLFPQRIIFVVLCITSFILIATPIATTIVLLAACHPFSANWASSEVQSVHCLNKEAAFVWGTIPNIFTDLVLLLIPLPIVWRLHTTTKIKIALSFTFIIGSLGLVASILRFISFFQTNSFTDATYNAVELIIWTLAEPGIYLISASLLMLRPLLDKVNIRFSSNIKRYVLFGRQPTTNSRVPKNSRDYPFGDDSDRNITLVSRGAYDGFVELGDNEGEHGERPRQNITVTTDIQQSWNGV